MDSQQEIIFNQGMRAVLGDISWSQQYTLNIARQELSATENYTCQGDPFADVN